MGGVRTIVSQEDGTCRAFGEAIVDSLLQQEEAKALRPLAGWLKLVAGDVLAVLHGRPEPSGLSQRA